jgi:hypothetical protein
VSIASGRKRSIAGGKAEQRDGIAGNTHDYSPNTLAFLACPIRSGCRKQERSGDRWARSASTRRLEDKRIGRHGEVSCWLADADSKSNGSISQWVTALIWL